MEKLYFLIKSYLKNLNLNLIPILNTISKFKFKKTQLQRIILKNQMKNLK